MFVEQMGEVSQLFSSYLSNLFQIQAVGERGEFYVLCLCVDMLDFQRKTVGCFQESVQLSGAGLNGRRVVSNPGADSSPNPG